MKDEDVRVGMRVIPHDKTAGMYRGLEQSAVWRTANTINQPYLFVVDTYAGAWTLSENKDDRVGSEYFRASDFEPYQPDLDRRIAKAERELARLIAERDAAKWLPVGAEVQIKGRIVEVDKDDEHRWHYRVEFDNRWKLWLRDEIIKEVE